MQSFNFKKVITMNVCNKYLLCFLLTISSSLFSITSVSAQTWNAVSGSEQNPCQTPPKSNQVQCQCNQGYTWGTAANTNCTMDGFVPGCWNPTSGTCNTCGTGGTVTLGQRSCFNNGQSNQGGNDPAAVGIFCNASLAASGCVGSGTTSGGFSTN
jgi:hypothetical protein